MGAVMTEPLVDQVRQALVAFHDAQNNATDAAADYLRLKRLIGSNEAERKAAKAATPDDVYAGYVSEFVTVEDAKNETAAHLERTEKQLNVLREMLNHETAVINRETAELRQGTACIEAETALTARQTAEITAAADPIY